MQVIQITSLTGHSPYDITICDITNTYCYSGVTGATTAPLTINVPTQLLGTTELLVVVTDSIGCQEIQYHSCGEFIPSQTPTTTPTPTPTNSTCNCISIKNPSGVTLNFGFTQCDGTSFYGPIYSATTLYVCGRLPYGDSGLIINISSDICTGDVCAGPTPTPTTTPTPTPTLPPIVGYFRDVCDSSYEFTLSDIPGSFSPLSGIYFIESSEYVGCATSIVSTTSTNIFSYIAMGSQPSIPYCLKSNFSYPCPTLTPTPSMTPTHTPTNTPTNTPTPTPTFTPTSTSPVKYLLFQAQSCCVKKIIKFIMLPANFLPGTAIVNSYGECLKIIGISIKDNWITDFWNHSTTYSDCELCIKYQTCEPVIPPSFISVWRTTTPNQSIVLPYETSGFYYGTIDWGDGSITSNTYLDRTHTYDDPGDYTITITGTLIGWSFFYNGSSFSIIDVLQWGCLRLGNNGFNFFGCENLSLSNVTDILNLDGTNNLDNIFAYCYNLTTIPFINSWDVSNITNMSAMFRQCFGFNEDISGWIVSNVTDMSNMFDSAISFNQPIGSWIVSGVTDMSFMFLSTNNFNQDLSSWDVSNVINMRGMFETSYVFNNLNSPMIDGWITSNVTNMSAMFSFANAFNQPIGSWDVSNVTDMSYMFDSAISFDQPIGSWDVSNVSDFFFFMVGKSFSDYSTTNLDNIYNGWSSLQSLQPSILIFFNNIKYTAAGSAGKAILQGSPNLWTITDGGI